MDEKTYLKLPTVNRETYKKIIEMLKEKGAEFNTENRCWYVKAAQEKEFQEYIKEIVLKERVYLRLPRANRDDFQKIIQDVKSRGARFDTEKKGWYIKPGQEEKFQDYLKSSSEKPSSLQEKRNITEKEFNEFLEDIRKSNEQWLNEFKLRGNPPALHLINNLHPSTFVVELKDGTVLEILQTDVLSKAGITPPNFEGMEFIVDAIEELIAEKVRIIETEEYSITIHKESAIDECHICAISDKSPEILKKPITVHEKELGIKLLEATDEELLKKVESYLTQIKNADPKEQCFYIPHYEISENISYVSGYEKINGIVIAENKISATEINYIVKTRSGDTLEIENKKLFSKEQVNVLDEASKFQFPAEKYDLFADPRMNVNQMREIIKGLQDGLQTLFVASYSNPQISHWKMELYRYGMNHGLKPIEIERVVDADGMNPTAGQIIINSMIRDIRQEMIRDMKKLGYHPDQKIIKAIEKLNHFTYRKNSLEDIRKAIKEYEKYKGTETGEILKKLQGYFREQKNLKQEQLVRTIDAPVR